MGCALHSLDRNAIANEGATGIARALTRHYGLRELECAHLPPTPSSNFPSARLRASLRSLSSNEITTSGVSLLATALENNWILETLWLSGNPLSKSDVFTLCGAVRNNAQLRNVSCVAPRAHPVEPILLHRLINRSGQHDAAIHES